MNIGIGRNSSLCIAGKPPRRADKYGETHGDKLDTFSKNIVINQSIASQPKSILLNKTKDQFQPKKLDSYTSLLKCHPVATKKSSISALNRAKKTAVSTITPKVPPKDDTWHKIHNSTTLEAYSNPATSPALTKETRHRRSNAMDFTDILGRLEGTLPAPGVITTRLAEEQQLVSTAMETTIPETKALPFMRTEQLWQEVFDVVRTRDANLSWSRPVLQPPYLPSVESFLDPWLTRRFQAFFHEFWALLTHKSKYICLTLKMKLLKRYQCAMEAMIEGFQQVLAIEQSRNDGRSGLVSDKKIRSYFSTLYESNTQVLACLIGMLQVYKRTKEIIGPLRNGMGIMWTYEHHSQHQNDHMHFVMIRWLYQNWECPRLEETEIVRLSVDEELMSIAVWGWWNHAMETVWRPFYYGIAPNPPGKRRQPRSRRQRQRSLLSRADGQDGFFYSP